MRRTLGILGGLALGSLAFSPSHDPFINFDDSDLVRIAIKSVSVYSRPTDKSSIVSTWFRDELLRVYEAVTADEPVRGRRRRVSPHHASFAMAPTPRFSPLRRVFAQPERRRARRMNARVTEM